MLNSHPEHVSRHGSVMEAMGGGATGQICRTEISYDTYLYRQRRAYSYIYVYTLDYILDKYMFYVSILQCVDLRLCFLLLLFGPNSSKSISINSLTH